VKALPDGISLVSAASETAPEERREVETGQWYWVTPEDSFDIEGKAVTAPYFACVVHIGSNFVELQPPGKHASSERIHTDVFWDRVRFEPDPDGVIRQHTSHYKAEVKQLLARVQAVTAALAVGPSRELRAGGETAALSLRQSEQSMDDYGKALVTAKKDLLPELFQEIKHANAALAKWMLAPAIPLRAEAESHQAVIEQIDDRIFSVELYAGLVEKVERVKDGEPAAMGDKIHIMQRLCYMDEECLAQYETGGMDYKGIEDFDAWLAKESNLRRLLPHPRSVVSFRVRRDPKERELVNISDYFRIVAERDLDKQTFLYIRNGGELWRLKTAIEFGARLFPDMARGPKRGKLWAKHFGHRFRDNEDEIITDDEYQAIVREWKEEKKKTPKADRWHLRSDPRREYEPYDQASVYADDIGKKIAHQHRAQNRIALILQGLLDRSPVFHPHPPWQIWTEDGYEAAFELCYDEARALVAGERPDFEAYRARCNASLKKGAVTVGQEYAWLREEGRKESRRLDRDWRNKSHYRPRIHQPYGNPGPGKLAKVSEWSPRSGAVGYAWNRDRQDWRSEKREPIRTTFSCKADKVLCVDGYKPGDFRIFFNDPRTRSEYLKWAPLLLEAEEYHAGNRTAKEPVAPSPKQSSSYEGQIRYERAQRRKTFMKKAVRLREDTRLKNGTMHKKGTLWRVTEAERGGTFVIVGISDDGAFESDHRAIRGMSYRDLSIDSDIPADPDEVKRAKRKPPPDEDDDDT